MHIMNSVKYHLYSILLHCNRQPRCIGYYAQKRPIPDRMSIIRAVDRNCVFCGLATIYVCNTTAGRLAWEPFGNAVTTVSETMEKIAIKDTAAGFAHIEPHPATASSSLTQSEYILLPPIPRYNNNDQPRWTFYFFNSYCFSSSF